MQMVQAPAGTCPLLPEWARRARRRAEPPDEHPALLRVVRVLRAWDEDCTLLRLARVLSTWELERAGFRIPPYVPS